MDSISSFKKLVIDRKSENEKMASSFENNVSVSDYSQLVTNGSILIDKFKTNNELQQFLKRLSSFKGYQSNKKVNSKFCIQTHKFKTQYCKCKSMNCEAEYKIWSCD